MGLFNKLRDFLRRRSQERPVSTALVAIVGAVMLVLILVAVIDQVF